MRGTIIKGMGGTYFASVQDKIVEVIPTGKIRKAKLIIGDHVEITQDNYSKKYVIQSVLPRKNQLIRPKVANIDTLCIVIASIPQPDYFLVDKLIIACKANQIQPVLVINKIDLNNYHSIVKEYHEILPIYLVSSLDRKGLEELKQNLEGKVTAFAGQSAVGKSTLISALYALHLASGEVSKKVERGKHTTRHSELFAVGNNAWVIDTPGFSLLELNGIKSQDLQEYYEDFFPYRKDCKFANCMHNTFDSSVCGVANAIKEGYVRKSRVERYQKLLEMVKQNEQKY